MRSSPRSDLSKRRRACCRLTARSILRPSGGAAHPEYASGRSFAGLVGLVVFVVPLVIALAASFAYVRRVSGGPNDAA
jgi:hypothetical protein